MNYSSGGVENNVLVGLSDYLFLFDGGQKSFKFSTGEERVLPEYIYNFFHNIEQRANFLNKKNIQFIHVVFPSKEIVLSKYVPKPWREKIQSVFISNYSPQDPILNNMLLYPIELLKDANLIKPVFRVLDSHMTDHGTMAVAMSILEKWGLQYNVADFFVQRFESRRGDLADMLKIKTKVTEEFLEPKFLFSTFDNRTSLPGNTSNLCILHNPVSTTCKRLLIFGDSYVKYTLPFLAPVFRDVVYVRSATFQSDMVDLMAPDYVISSNAERYLCKVDSDAASIPMLFAHYGKTDYTPPSSFIKAYKAQFCWQHHREVYDAWARKIQLQSGVVSWEKLGVCRPNSQIETLNLDGHFLSTGSDPYFVFPNAEIDIGKLYVLEVEIKSFVESRAAVYFQAVGDDVFSEEKCLKLPVVKGVNYLKFHFPIVNLKSTLRFDPLGCKGRFSIESMMLSDCD